MQTQFESRPSVNALNIKYVEDGQQQPLSYRGGLVVVDSAVLSDARDLVRHVRMRVRRRSGAGDAPSIPAAAAAAAGRHEERVGGRAPQFEAFLAP